MKDIRNRNTDEARSTTQDIKVMGNPDVWHLLCKASSQKQGWMKSTKVMELPNGCLIQISTQQDNRVAEALAFIPDIKLSDLSF